jgi:hypothetical protein
MARREHLGLGGGKKTEIFIRNGCHGDGELNHTLSLARVSFLNRGGDDLLVSKFQPFEGRG